MCWVIITMSRFDAFGNEKPNLYYIILVNWIDKSILGVKTNFSSKSILGAIILSLRSSDLMF